METNFKHCPYCGSMQQQDVLFCTECGRKLDTPQIIPPSAKVYGTQPAPTETEPHKKKRKFSIFTNIKDMALFFGGIIIILLAATVVVQQNSHNAALDRHQQIYNEYRHQVESLEQQLSQSQQTLDSVMADLECYSTVVQFLQSRDAGRASDSFYADRSIVVLAADGQPKTVNITCQGTDGKVSHNAESSSVALRWQSQWNGDTIGIDISATQQGASHILFTDVATGQTFRILVLVV